MIIQIGTKIYYCNKTGDILAIIGDCEGHVLETTFEQDLKAYKQLQQVEIQDISVLKFEFGEYFKLSKDATSVKIDIETRELIFSYESIE